ncbi:MAG: NAD(P)/FAD-dependent oxidoreductase [Coriobacteriales bacterium]|jgi:predicted Rossmann fold flavoprotein|nr:NAD(P)/FAD-dependent oxidoreductase [Coriobacteriales bacterium]
MTVREADVVVVGGGAAGLMAAIAAARGGASVVLIEGNERVGKTILKTGNGRCNLSNTAIEGAGGAAPYNHPAFVASVLERYGCEAVRAFFADLGLLTTVDAHGWVFPRTRVANSVLDVLLGEMRRQGVGVYTGHAALDITHGITHDASHGITHDATHNVANGKTQNQAQDAPQKHGSSFLITTAQERFAGRALVCACGVTPLLATMGAPGVVSSQPVLGPLQTNTAPLKGLDGIRANCRIRLLDEGVLSGRETVLTEEDGEVLFRSYGISGIAVFNVSRFARPGLSLSLDFFPEFSLDELRSLLVERSKRCRGTRPGSNHSLSNNSNPGVSGILDGMLHSRLAQAVLRRLEGTADSSAEGIPLPRLAALLTDYRLSVTGGPSSTQAQVTRGGLATQGFESHNLQSRLVPGLFAAGECLDIDGPCGGFNLHWAWASGLVAGEAAAQCALNRIP